MFAYYNPNFNCWQRAGLYEAFGHVGFWQGILVKTATPQQGHAPKRPHNLCPPKRAQHRWPQPFGQNGHTWPSIPKALTHWGRETHTCVSELTIIGSDNGLSPSRRQAIIWTNAGILLIWHLGTNFSEISIEIHTFSLKKIYLKMSSGKWR